MLKVCANTECGVSGATKRCGACSDVFYCSADCQKKHWSSGHKRECISKRKPPAAAPPVDSLEHDEMIQFEKADLQEEHGYSFFETLWPTKGKAMVAHALASHGVFQWDGFKSWLKTKASTDKFAQHALQSFGVSVESAAESGQYRELKDVLPMIRSLHPNGDLMMPRVDAPKQGSSITRVQLLYLIASKAPDGKNFMKAIEQMRKDGNKPTKEKENMCF